MKGNTSSLFLWFSYFQTYVIHNDKVTHCEVYKSNPLISLSDLPVISPDSINLS